MQAAYTLPMFCTDSQENLTDRPEIIRAVALQHDRSASYTENAGAAPQCITLNRRNREVSGGARIPGGVTLYGFDFTRALRILAGLRPQ